MEAGITDTETSAELQSALAAMFRGVPRARAAVGLWQSGRGTAYAAIPARARPVGVSGGWPVPCGCLTKLFTAALIEQVIAAGAIDLDTRLGDVLGPRAPRTRSTVRQALEHRHGLDDSRLDQAPRDAAGRIDAARLGTLLGPPLFPPGSLYSYANVGAWLSAALLEALQGRPYRRLLLDWAEAHDLPLRARDRAAAICPALGGALVTSLPGLLGFARRAIDAPWWRDSGPPVPLPGWNPLERGMLRGFKYYGHGWFGHQSIRPGAAAWLRLAPRRGIAVVVASGRHAAPVIALRLFARRLPGFAPEPAPARLPDDGPLAACPVPGRYGNSAHRIEIAVHPGRPATARAGPHRAKLRAAEQGVFYLDPPVPRSVPFVQFVRGTHSGAAYLWNGREIYAPFEDKRRVCARRAPGTLLHHAKPRA